MSSSGILGRVVRVRNDVSEELIAYSIRVTRITELGTTFKSKFVSGGNQEDIEF
jgi:hypothetical protein